MATEHTWGRRASGGSGGSSTGGAVAALPHSGRLAMEGAFPSPFSRENSAPSPSELASPGADAAGGAVAGASASRRLHSFARTKSSFDIPDTQMFDSLLQEVIYGLEPLGAPLEDGDARILDEIMLPSPQPSPHEALGEFFLGDCSRNHSAQTSPSSATAGPITCVPAAGVAPAAGASASPYPAQTLSARRAVCFEECELKGSVSAKATMANKAQDRPLLHDPLQAQFAAAAAGATAAQSHYFQAPPSLPNFYAASAAHGVIPHNAVSSHQQVAHLNQTFAVRSAHASAAYAGASAHGYLQHTQSQYQYQYLPATSTVQPMPHFAFPAAAPAPPVSGATPAFAMANPPTFSSASVPEQHGTSATGSSMCGGSSTRSVSVRSGSVGPESLVGSRRDTATASSVDSYDSNGQKIRKKKNYKRTTASKFCHICLRKETAVQLAVCHNITSGTCLKVVCQICFNKFGWDWEAAMREHSEWTCTHCRGECPSSARCRVYEKVNNRREPVHKQKNMSRVVFRKLSDIPLLPSFK